MESKFIAVKPKVFILWAGKGKECDDYYEDIVDFLQSNYIKKLQFWTPLGGFGFPISKENMVKSFLQYLDSIGYRAANEEGNVDLIMKNGISIQYTKE